MGKILALLLVLLAVGYLGYPSIAPYGVVVA